MVGKMRLWRAGIVVAVSFACVASFLLSGCVFSDAITERVYDSDENSIIDTDLDPILINSIDAQETSDRLPKLTNDPDDDVKSDTVLQLPTYSADPAEANTDEPAGMPQYAPNSLEEGDTADQTAQDAPSPLDQASNPTSDQSGNGSQPTPGEGEDPAPEGDGGSDEDTPGEADDDKGDDEPDDENQGARQSGGTGSVFTNDPNAEEPEIPENIDEVAAVGNAAVIVSMVSGSAESTSLLACDSATKSAMGGILANRGIGSAEALWANDGSSSGDLSEESFNRLVDEVVPDLVFVTEGSEMFTEDQLVTLEQKNIDIFYLPRLVSANRIRYAVKAVGMTLAKGGVAGAEENYQAYLNYHDSLLSRYVNANGGITGGYNFDSDKEAPAASKTVVTLFVDKWDADARLTGSTFLDTSTGVGVASLGYNYSPLNYYMSSGGVLNNAVSAKIRQYSTSGAGIVWQFAQNELNYSFGNWRGLHAATFDLASVIKGGVYTSDLMWYTGGDISGFGLGTASFPAIVTKSKALEANVKGAASKSGGVYYAYPTIYPASIGSTVGFFTDASEEAYVEACIGNGGSESTLNGKQFDIYVNPKGLAQASSADELCSWTNGSLESVLESSWANYRFRGGTRDGFRADVSEFYSLFYGYTLTGAELDAIESGVAE